MTKPKDDSIRQKAINDRNANFLLEAGAGTGKTHTLVRRILSLLQGDKPKTSLDRIAAITFTEKAAADLKLKVREIIEEQAAISHDEKLTRAIGDIDRAPIMTLHGFCLSLLKERPVEAGIDPLASILDPRAASTLAENIYDDWFDEMAANPTPAFRWYLIKKDYYHRRSNEDWLWKLASRIIHDSDILLDFKPNDNFDFPKSVQSFFDLEKTIFDFAQQHCLNQDDKGFCDCTSFHDAVLKLPEPNNEDDFADAFQELPAVKLSGGNMKNWKKGSLPEFKEDRKKLKQFVDPFSRVCHSSRIWELFTLTQEFARRYDAEKQRIGALDFSDILTRTLEMLQNNQDNVRRYFRNKFDHIFIDEFQDTDPLQMEIASWLCSVSDAKSHDNQEFSPGKLFVVGDPKQSIYRFRRADIEIYEETKRNFESRGEAHKIQVNFRSVPNILDFVNHAFRPLMVQDVGEPASPDYVELMPFRGQDGEGIIPDDSGVVFIAPNRPLDENDDPLRLEYAAIAKWINDAVASHLKIPDKVKPGEKKTFKLGGALKEIANDGDKPKDFLRDMRFGDIAILNRRGTTFAELEETLGMYGIDYIVTGGKVYFQRPEVIAAVSAMSCLNNPDDSLSLAEWLTCDLVGFSDEDLLIHTLSKEDETLSYASLPEPCENEDDLTKHLRAMREIHEKRDEVGCCQTLKSLFTLSAAIPAAQALRRGDVAVANLNKILDASRAADAKRSTFGEFAAEWAQAFKSQRDEADHNVAEQEDDVVRILTIHKGKGLDWPVVIIPDMAAQFRGGSSPPILTQRVQKRVGIRLAKNCETFQYDEMNEREKLFSEAERIRLLYVAMTRARDYLVLPLFSRVIRKKDSTVRTQKGFLEFLVRAGVINDELKLADPIKKLVRDSVKFDVNKKDLKLATSPSWNLPKIVKEKGDDLPEGVAEALRLRSENPQPPPIQETAPRFHSPSAHETEFTPGEGSPDGQKLGSAFHELMENLDFNEPSSWSLSLDATAFKHGLSQDGRAQCEKWLNNFSETELFQALQKCVRYTEVPFTWKGRDPESGAVRDFGGSIDLLAHSHDDLYIVDYKTDRVSGIALKKRFESYRRQGAIYLEAVKSLVPGAARCRMVFCFVDPGIEMELNL
jgi:ATP-dependent helicase/nuclease subunit A